MSGKKEKRRHERNVLLATIGLVLTAGLLILLALYLLFGGRKEQEPVVSAVQDSQEELSQKTEEETEEDPQASYEPEETGTPVEISTVKEVAGETDETTTGIDVSEFQGNIDWDQVADTGIDFVMVRVGYRTAGSGEIREDACARYNLQGGVRQRHPSGRLLFLHSGNGRRSQGRSPVGLRIPGRISGHISGGV